MRSGGESNIKRKQTLNKYKKNNTSAQQTRTNQPTQQNVTAPPTYQTRGAAAARARDTERKAQQPQSQPQTTSQATQSELKDDKVKKSTDLLGQEIKLDDEGRYDLTEIKKMPWWQQTGVGVPVTTEQIIQLPKDIIQGVKTEDQAMKESLFDLGLSPLLMHLATAKQTGLTDKDWYWPTELTAQTGGVVDSLPQFLHKTERQQSKGILEGIGHNLGIIADIATHEDSGNMLGEEYAISADRFMQAPAYYVGTAIGEIPYWVIGVGQAKLAAQISTKAAAATIKYSAKTGRLPGPKHLKKIIQTEKAHHSTVKGIQKARVAIVEGKSPAFLAPIVTKALKLMKDELDFKLNEKLDENRNIINKAKNENKQLEKKHGELKTAITKENDVKARGVIGDALKSVDADIKNNKKIIQTNRNIIKDKTLKSDYNKIKTMIGDLKAKHGDKVSYFNTLQKIESTVGERIGAQYKEIRLTKDNLIKIRSEKLKKDVAKIDSSINDYKKMKGKYGEDDQVILKLTNKKKKLDDQISQLEDTQGNQWLLGDELMSNIDVFPGKVGSRIKEKLSPRAQAGDNIPRIPDSELPTISGQLRGLWDFHTGPIKHMMGREVRNLTEQLRPLIPDISIISADEHSLMRGRMKTELGVITTRIGEARKLKADHKELEIKIDYHKEEIGGSAVNKKAHKASLERLEDDLAKIESDPMWKELEEGKPRDPKRNSTVYDEWLTEEAQLKKAIDSTEKYESRLGFGEKSPKAMSVNLDFLKKYLSEDAFEKIRPKEIITIRQSDLSFQKVGGVMIGRTVNKDSPLASQFEMYIVRKHKPIKPAGRVRSVARQFKPRLPKLKPMTMDNSELILWSRNTSVSADNVLRVPKDIPKDLKTVLRTLLIYKNKDSNEVIRGLTGGSDKDLYYIKKLSDEQKSQPDDTFIYTNQFDSSKILPDSLRDQKLTLGAIEYGRKLLMNRLDFAGERASIQKVLDDAIERREKKVKSGSAKSEDFIPLTKEVDKLKEKIYNIDLAEKSYKDAIPLFKEYGIGNIGVGRGQIQVIDLKELKGQPIINQTNILYSKKTGKKYYIHTVDGKDEIWEINDMDAITDNMIIEPGRKFATWKGSTYTGLDGKNITTTRTYRDTPISKTSVATLGTPVKKLEIDREPLVEKIVSDIEMGQELARNISTNKIILEIASKDPTRMKKNPDGVPYLTKLSDKQVSQLNHGNFSAMVSEHMNKIFKEGKTRKAKTTVETKDDGTQIAKKDKSDIIKGIIAIESSQVIDDMSKKTSKKLQNFKNQILGEEYELLSIPRMSTDAESMATYGGSNEGYVRALGNISPFQKAIISSADRLFAPRPDDPLFPDKGILSGHAFPIQGESAIKGLKQYNIYDVEYIGAREPKPRDSWLKHAEDQMQIGEFKNENIDINDNYAMLLHIAKKKGMERNFKEKLINTHLYVKNEIDPKQINSEVKKIVQFDKKGVQIETEQYNIIIKEIKDKNLLRNPTPQDFLNLKKVKRVGRKPSLDRQIGIIGMKHNFPNIAKHIPESGVRGISNRVKYNIQSQLSSTGNFLINPKHLLSGRTERLRYGVTKDYLIHLEENPAVKKGWIQGYERARDEYKIKMPRGYVNLYDAIKGKVNSPLSQALERYIVRAKEDKKLQTGFTEFNVSGKFQEGTILEGRLTTKESDRLIDVKTEIKDVENVLNNRIKFVKEDHTTLLYLLKRDSPEVLDAERSNIQTNRNRLEELYLEKAYLEKRVIDEDNYNLMNIQKNDDSFATDFLGEIQNRPDIITDMQGQIPLKYNYKNLDLSPPKPTSWRISERNVDYEWVTKRTVTDLNDLDPENFNISKTKWNDAKTDIEKQELLWGQGFPVDIEINTFFKVTDKDGFVTYKKDLKTTPPGIEKDEWKKMSISEKISFVKDKGIIEYEGGQIEAINKNVEHKFLRTLQSIETGRKYKAIPPANAKKVLTLDAQFGDKTPPRGRFKESKQLHDEVVFLESQLSGPSVTQDTIRGLSGKDPMGKLIPITATDHARYNPSLNPGKKLDGLRNDSITSIVELQVLKDLDIDPIAYTKTSKLIELVKNRETLKTTLREELEKTFKNPTSTAKTHSRINTIQKDILDIDNKIDAYVKSHKTTGPKTILKQQTTVYEQPGDVHKRIFGFGGSGFMSDEYLKQFQQKRDVVGAGLKIQSITNQNIGTGVTVTKSDHPRSDTEKTVQTKEGFGLDFAGQTNEGIKTQALLSSSILQYDTPASVMKEINTTQKSVLGTSLTANMNYLDSQLQNTIRPVNTMLGQIPVVGSILKEGQITGQTAALIPQTALLIKQVQLLTHSTKLDVMRSRLLIKDMPQHLAKRIKPTDLLTTQPASKHQLIYPIGFIPPPYLEDPYKKRTKHKKTKGKKKKTWWRTPGWWYESDYWGGTDNLGAGYVTFKGQEPGKVKRYEKKTFGMGVGF